MMMDNEMLKTGIELVIVIVSFFVGRYILPKHKADIQAAAAEFQVLLNYAESFVAYARQFIDAPGEEKMNTVVEKLKAICEKQGIKVDEETLRAIAQKAYDAMKAGENSSKVIIESAVEELKLASSLVVGVEETAKNDTVTVDIPNTKDDGIDIDPFIDDTK